MQRWNWIIYQRLLFVRDDVFMPLRQTVHCSQNSGKFITKILYYHWIHYITIIINISNAQTRVVWNFTVCLHLSQRSFFISVVAQSFSHLIPPKTWSFYLSLVIWILQEETLYRTGAINSVRHEHAAYTTRVLSLDAQSTVIICNVIILCFFRPSI